jgi:hypothetical protein
VANQGTGCDHVSPKGQCKPEGFKNTYKDMRKDVILLEMMIVD